MNVCGRGAERRGYQLQLDMRKRCASVLYCVKYMRTYIIAYCNCSPSLLPAGSRAPPTNPSPLHPPTPHPPTATPAGSSCCSDGLSWSYCTTSRPQQADDEGGGTTGLQGDAVGFGKLTPGFLFEEAGWRGLGRMGEEWCGPAILSVVGCTVIKHCLVRLNSLQETIACLRRT